MVQYATASQLAGYLQRDAGVDTYSADQVLQVASALFSRAAETMFAATTTTWSVVADGRSELELPFHPVSAVSAVRVNGVAVTGWSLRLDTLYRAAGFGYRYAWPPDQADVDLTYGYSTAGDDVKGAVLETAAQAYDVPMGAVASESIDDYAVRYATTGGGLQLTASAAALAAGYRGVLLS